MEIHVARKSSSLGVFSAEEVRAGLATGRFVTTDLAWREGMPEWKALSEWEEFRSATPPASPVGLAAAPAADLPESPSWERGASFSNFFATIKEVALDPVRTFDGLRPGGYGRPIAFTYASLLPAWLCGSAVYGGLIFFMFSLGGNAAGGADPVEKFIGDLGPGLASLLASLAIGVIFLLMPLFSFVGSGVSHLLLLPWNPRGGFAQTYRAQAYACGAFMPFAFVPCLNYVVGPWQLVAIVIAYSRVHQIAWWKVLISTVVVPCCAGCALYLFLIAALMGAAG